MKVIVYDATANSRSENELKHRLLRAFYDGIKIHEKNVKLETREHITDCDVAVIMGYFHFDAKYKTNIRRHIYNYQKAQGKEIIFIDSDVFKSVAAAKDPYVRVCSGSIYPDEADFWNKGVPGDRWEDFRKNRGIPFHPYRKRGDHILLCSQRISGWMAKQEDIMKWLKKTIGFIRKVKCKRKIVFRPHPVNGVSAYRGKIVDPLGKMEFVEPKAVPIEKNLKKCHAAILYNSSVSVPILLHGIPIFAFDPSCIAWKVANKEIKNIEKPNLIDREAWLNRLAYAHWNEEELRSGIVWQRFIKSYKRRKK